MASGTFLPPGLRQPPGRASDDELFTLGTDEDFALVLNTAANSANAAIDGVLVGTPVTPALAVNSAIISNTTEDGDILFAVRDGDHSKGLLHLDGANGKVYIYGGDSGLATPSATSILVLENSGEVEMSLIAASGVARQILFGQNGDAARGAIIYRGSTDSPADTLEFRTASYVLGMSLSSTVLTMGDGLSADTAIIFDGNAVDYHIGLDDTADALVIGKGTALGTTTAMSINAERHIGFNGVSPGAYSQTLFSADADTIPAAGVSGEIARVYISNSNAITIGTGVTGLAASMIIWEPNIVEAGGDGVTNAATLYIGNAPTEGSAGNYAILVNSGSVRFNGAISLAADHGDDGQQLTSGGDDTACDWTAASSLREYKDIGEQASPQDALETMLSTPAYHFHYKEKKGTGDSSTEYIGVMADEAAWAMHYNGSIVNPVNALGYTVLSVQALNAKIEKLEQALGV
jgi:hypothetical protein